MSNIQYPTIPNLCKWKTYSRNVYAGHYYPIHRSIGYGNPYTLQQYGRDEGIKLYKLHTIPTLTNAQLQKIKLAHEVACHCGAEDKCHAETLIKPSFCEFFLLCLYIIFVYTSYLLVNFSVGDKYKYKLHLR